MSTIYPLRGIAECHMLQDQKDSAIYYFKRTLSVATQYKRDLFIPHLLGDLAKVYLYQKNDIDSAFLLTSLSIQTDSSDWVLSTRADAYERQGKLDSAMQCLLISKDNSEIYTKASSFNSLYRIGKKMNQHEQACIYADSFIFYWDSINVTNKHVH